MKFALLPALAMATLAASPALAAKPISAIDAVHQLDQAERDFDAYTHVHGYNQGFFKYSTPDAIEFDPGPVRIHDQTAAALKADPADKPSKLRWAPHWIGMAASRDMAWDLGTWKVEGSDAAGWFLTVWQRQPDGTWLWTLDGGVGPIKPGHAPAASNNAVSLNFGVSPAPATSAGEAQALDDKLNSGLAMQGGFETYKALGWTLPDIVAGDAGPPALNDGYNTTADADRQAMLATRPQGLSWTRDGENGSSGGDMVYTYGHASDAGGVFKGHYVRLWHKLSADPASWVIVADIYQAAP